MPSLSLESSEMGQRSRGELCCHLSYVLLYWSHQPLGNLRDLGAMSALATPPVFISPTLGI